jgi:flagellar M-ring protein FliF
MQFVQSLAVSLARLGPRRLLLLGATGLVVVLLILFSVHSLQKPVRSVLYSGLTKADVSEIGAALSEVGIAFDVNEAGDAVLVDFGKSAQARMLLAERGLPKSDKSGYELFDQMGSLGLTSFMQQVTKLRALEGELIRTIQQLDGVKSARVHLAVKAEGVLRNKDSKPTASVVIRVDGTPREGLAGTIRHIVAAAIPGLMPDQVMVSTTNGTLLAGPTTADDSGSSTLLDLEKKLSLEVSKRVTNTLEPFAGAENIRVSVSAAINFDKRQTNETKYDPDSKVERSSSVTKSLDSTEDATGDGPVSVDQNIPQEVRPQAAAAAASKKKEDKQETINYEVDTKQTAITSAGYTVTKMSVAVVINRKAMLGSLPAGSDEKLIAQRISEIEDVVHSAAGLDKSRGDDVKISLIDFFEAVQAPEIDASLGIVDHIVGNLGSIINAVGVIIAILVVLLLGLRPALRILVAERVAPSPQIAASGDMAQAVLGGPAHVMPSALGNDGTENTDASTPDARDQLNKLVNVDVDRAAQVVKKWLNETERTAA